jgi:hypothetical protein
MIPTCYRCPKHPKVEVVLYVPATAYCTRCAKPLRAAGYAVPVQQRLFGEPDTSSGKPSRMAAKPLGKE